MPDYCACRDKTCEKRLKCARYRMIWETHQNYSHSLKSNKKHFDCVRFVDTAGGAPFALMPEDKADKFHTR